MVQFTFNAIEGHHLRACAQVWLAQWGISHWGRRVEVAGWEAHDCTRGANIFGVAALKDAVINGRSDNVPAK